MCIIQFLGERCSSRPTAPLLKKPFSKQNIPVKFSRKKALLDTRFSVCMTVHPLFVRYAQTTTEMVFLKPSKVERRKKIWPYFVRVPFIILLLTDIEFFLRCWHVPRKIALTTRGWRLIFSKFSELYYLFSELNNLICLHHNLQETGFLKDSYCC